ncbi:hypothetical protein N7471_004731 [Penicillium samsonianum]|uniref:uncharacterized protein n=1 Tax=Penicillium samsonianum TaxID=1882272 RepID=UPI0025484B57|nr:uncharacterized protein N7471_004731 [Penicillium samsonianum]KAJ6138245.1 hypothetical protein N7471_004731 [Penicillium samsonianum]
MTFSRKSGLLSLFAFVGGSSASNPIGGPITGDMTKYETTVSGNPSLTVITADIVAPSGSTAVIDLALITPGRSSTPILSATFSTPCLSSSCPVTLTPTKFPPAVPTWIQHLETTVTVPASSTPVIHFSPIVPGEASPTSELRSSAVKTSAGIGKETGSAGSQSLYPTSTTTPALETPSTILPAGVLTSQRPQESPSSSGVASENPPESPNQSPAGSASPSQSTPLAPGTGGQPSSRTPLQPGQSATSLATPDINTKTRTETALTSPSQSTPIAPGTGRQPSASAPLPSGQSSTPLGAPDTQTESTPPSPSQLTPSGPGASPQPPTNTPVTSGQPSANTPLQSGHLSTPLATPNSNAEISGTTPTPSSGGITSGPIAQSRSGSLSDNPGQSTNGSPFGRNPTSTITGSNGSILGIHGTTSSPDSSQPIQSGNPSSGRRLTGTSSAEVAAILSLHPTNTATEAWDDLKDELSQIPTTAAATTGSAEATQGVAVAAWIGKLGNNIKAADLKDKGTWTEVHDDIGKAKDRVEDYVKERTSNDNSGGGSSETGCSSGTGLLNLFKAASCVIKEAQNSLKQGVKDIGNSINAGWDLTKQGLSELEAEMPEVDQMNTETEAKFKNEFDNISEVAQELEELEKEEEKKTESSSQSSDSTTCTSTKTVTDCSSTTLLVTTTTTGNDGSATPSTSTTTTNQCSTHVGCDVTATTMMTTQTTGSACNIDDMTDTTFSITAPTYTITDGCQTITGTITLPSFRGTQSPDSTTASLTPIPYASLGSELASSSVTTPASSSSASTTQATTTSSDMCELQVFASTYSVCSCSSTYGGHTLSHAMIKPSSKECSDIKTFPMMSFIQVPTATPTSTMCSHTHQNIDGNTGAFCYCSTTSESEAIAKLPYTMGSMTVLYNCALITKWPSSTVSESAAEQTQPTVTMSDYTSTDIGNGNVFVFSAGKEYLDYNKYGISQTGPITMTTGLGSPIEEIVHDWTETNGHTEYVYATATGADSEDMKGVGQPTKTIVAYAATGTGDPMKEFYIGMHIQNAGLISNQEWAVWNPSPGKKVNDWCDGFVGSEKVPDSKDLNEKSWPPTLDFNDIQWGEKPARPDCKYTAGSGGAGTISCDGSEPIDCSEAKSSDGEDFCGAAGSQVTAWSQGRVHCILY